MFKTESYLVYENGEKIGYLDRQGEDGRFIDLDRDYYIHSFCPWGDAIKWAKKSGYKLKQVPTELDKMGIVE